MKMMNEKQIVYVAEPNRALLKRLHQRRVRKCKKHRLHDQLRNGHEACVFLFHREDVAKGFAERIGASASGWLPAKVNRDKFVRQSTEQKLRYLAVVQAADNTETTYEHLGLVDPEKPNIPFCNAAQEVAPGRLVSLLKPEAPGLEDFERLGITPEKFTLEYVEWAIVKRRHDDWIEVEMLRGKYKPGTMQLEKVEATGVIRRIQPEDIFGVLS
jgi:hypothetical protein